MMMMMEIRPHSFQSLIQISALLKHNKQEQNKKTFFFSIYNNSSMMTKVLDLNR